MKIQSERLFLGAVGKPNVGKSSFGTALSEATGIAVQKITISEPILTEIIIPRKLAPTRENYQIASEELGGANALADRAFAKADSLPSNVIPYIDGIRFDYTVSALRERGGLLLGVVASDRFRYDHRGNKSDELAMTFEEFKEKSVQNYESEIERLLGQADDLIVNRSGWQAFVANVGRWYRAYASLTLPF